MALFVLMGEILFRSGTVDVLFTSVDRLIGRLRGRLYVVSIALSTVFGALSGSAVAVAAMLGRSVLPLMKRRDYDAFRAPNGTFLDLWETFNARPLYDPAAIRCPTLLIRGGADPTSTRSDALRLFDGLGAADRQYVEIANGAHFVSAERRAPAVFDVVNAFLHGERPGAGACTGVEIRRSASRA